MTVLIIGSGLVGSQIARILVEQGERPVLMDHSPQPQALGEIVDLAKVKLVQGDVLRPFSITEMIREHGIDSVILTAANPMLTLGAQRDPFSAIQLNIMGVVNVLEAARIHKLKRVVVSSSNVLNHYIAGGEGDGDGTGPVNEEAHPRPTTFYATTKQTLENLGLNYAKWAGVDFAAMRYGAVAGPWSGAGGGGPSNVFRTAVENTLSGGEALVPAGGMEWVYSKDAAMGTVLALQAKALPSRIFNVTMGGITTPDQLAAALRALNPKANVRIETPQGTQVSLPNMVRTSDLRRAREVLGYAPKYPLAEAIADMAQWLKARASKA